jgi:hypothetical protein
MCPLAREEGRSGSMQERMRLPRRALENGSFSELGPPTTTTANLSGLGADFMKINPFGSCESVASGDLDPRSWVGSSSSPSSGHRQFPLTIIQWWPWLRPPAGPATTMLQARTGLVEGSARAYWPSESGMDGQRPIPRPNSIQREAPYGGRTGLLGFQVEKP